MLVPGWVTVVAVVPLGGLLAARALSALGRVAGTLRRTGGWSGGVLHGLGEAAVPGFGLVALAFLAQHRLGVDPVGVGAVIIRLTAVHFTYAGAVTAAVVTRSARAGTGIARTRDLAVVLALLGPPLTALGFALLPVLQVVGAAVMTAALWTWAVAAGGVVAPGASGARRWGIARLSVLASMPLALWWATGTVVGFSVPSIPTMAATHGVLNAVGFAACGLWALHTAGVRPTPAARVARRR